MDDTAFNTIVALKILKERFAKEEDEWKMIAKKAYHYLKKKHLLDNLAVDNIIEELKIYYQ